MSDPVKRLTDAADYGTSPASDTNDLLREAALYISEFSLRERTADTLDAERYRYLRNIAGQYKGEDDGPSVCSGLSDLFEYHFGPEVDEVVDAAIAAWKAAGSPVPKEAA